MLWSCRDPEEEALEPPAKRPRLFKRDNTAQLVAALQQRVVVSVVNWLRGLRLDTIAVKVMLKTSTTEVCIKRLPGI